jgi:hypothetical protein
MNKQARFIYCVMCIMLFLASGCTGSLSKNYGRITPDSHVTMAFETYQINPNYNYYISGSAIYPHAIIGLDKALTLEPDLWKPVEITPEKLRELIEDMKLKVVGLKWNLILHGFVMFDEKGKQIGVWYSLPATTTSLRMKDDHTVIIITPDMDTYLRYEG